MASSEETENYDQSVVARYHNHDDAEQAVRQLERGGIPIRKVSIIGRDFQYREDIQGYYRPSDAMKEGAGVGAWFGGLFGILLGFGFFIVPGVGPLFALGPLAGLIAGAIGGAGVGAVVNALVSIGIPKDDALKYQSRVTAGEFLVLVVSSQEEVEKARQILEGTTNIDVNTHSTAQRSTAGAVS